MKDDPELNRLSLSFRNRKDFTPFLTDDDLRRLISLSSAYCDLVRFAGIENPVAKRVEQLLIMLLTPAFVVESK